MPHVTFADRYERKQGKIEGEIEGQIDGIEAALEIKFGSADAALMADVRRIEDPDRVAAILKGVKTATTIDDVRKLLAPANGTGAPETGK